MEQTAIIPSLAYNIDYRCNMRCVYCPEYFENYQETNSYLNEEFVFDLLAVTRELGLVTYRLTGGEPLLNIDHTLDVIKFLQPRNDDRELNVRLNTNGFLLRKYVDRIFEAGECVFKISLDTMNPKTFANLTKVNGFHEVIEGIKEVSRRGGHVELNMVLTKENSEDFWEILEFCKEYQIAALKVLDLVEYDKAFWVSNYHPTETIVDKLIQLYGQPDVLSLSDGRGVRQHHFQVNNNTQVIIRDGKQPKTYSEAICRDCPLFPCQLGIYNLTLNTDGKLKPCRLRTDLYYDLAKILDGKTSDQRINILKDLVSDLLGTIYAKTFLHDGWKDKNHSSDSIPVVESKNILDNQENS